MQIVAFRNLKPYIMRNLALIFTALVFGATNASAVTLEDKVAPGNAYGYNNSFIFVENGITFSVYPDGEFDFYIDQGSGINANVNFRNANITFNSGYNYDPYVQYDDYGAVVQVENVTVYYDYYGRVNQIGGVDINYYNGRVSRLGGLYVYYDNSGFYSHHRGYINIYNRNYVYAPFHGYFIRPALGFSLVFGSPYRQYYTPVRYTYYRPYQHNYRRAYAKIGHEHGYDVHNHNKRAIVYRNDNRVAENNSRRTEAIRSNNTVNRSNVTSRSSSTVQRNTIPNRSGAKKGNTVGTRSYERNEAPRREEVGSVSRSGNTAVNRNSGNSQTRSTVNREANGKQVNRPLVNTGVSRSNTNYVKTQSKNNNAPQRKASVRSGSNTSSNGSKSTASRSSVSRTVSNAASANTRSTVSNGRSASVRSNVRSQ